MPFSTEYRLLSKPNKTFYAQLKTLSPPFFVLILASLTPFLFFEDDIVAIYRSPVKEFLSTISFYSIVEKMPLIQQ